MSKYTIREIIKYCGTQKELAKALGITQAAVSNFIRINKIPAHHAPAIQQLVKKKTGIDLTIDEICSWLFSRPKLEPDHAKKVRQKFTEIGGSAWVARKIGVTKQYLNDCISKGRYPRNLAAKVEAATNGLITSDDLRS